jgi:threonine dehydrogenase-like Zn-dependent dehydrogenase
MTLVVRERELVGSYGSEPDEVAEVIGLLADGSLKLPRLIGDTIALEDVREGVQRVHDGRTGGSRIIVDLEA